MKSILILLTITLFTNACTTEATKDEPEMYFGDLPPNPFIIQKNKKGVNE